MTTREQPDEPPDEPPVELRICDFCCRQAVIEGCLCYECVQVLRTFMVAMRTVTVLYTLITGEEWDPPPWWPT